MSRALSLLFAILAYAIFFATFLYLIVFVGDFNFAGRTVDVGTEAPVAVAVVIDIALILLFGLQHSVMARPAFKAKWTRIVPPQAERSVYVLAASIALMIMFLFWRPIDSIVWNVSNPILSQIIWLLFWLGWAMVYKYVRHPLYLGFFLAFWAAPEMTAGHLLLAAGVSAYMLIAIRYEERDLTDLFGDDYRNYRHGVGMLLPRFKRSH
jgi:protein-S-isoprenylcysteine O-methyltransferase Ste14